MSEAHDQFGMSSCCDLCLSVYLYKNGGGVVRSTYGPLYDSMEQSSSGIDHNNDLLFPAIVHVCAL